MSNSALFLVVLITAVVLVGAALLIALWLAPFDEPAEGRGV